MASAPRSETVSEVPALTPERPVIWPPRLHAKLSNGLEIVLVESHTIPKFTGQLFFRSGNAVTAASAPGLADMTATMVRTGTTVRASRQIEEDLRRMGADLSSGAGADTSVVSFAGLVDFSKYLLRLVSELTQHASFPADEFERERRQLVEELRIERTTPGFLANERFRRVLFGAHPYGTVSPTEAQVESYELGQLVDFYRQNYRPGNALLVMVGDFPAKDMLEQVENIFGSWADGKAAEAPDPPLPELHGRHVYLGALAGIRADASPGRQSRHHAAKSGLAAVDARQFHLWRRIQFATGDEYPGTEGLYVQPAQWRASPAATRVFQHFRRCPE